MSDADHVLDALADAYASYCESNPDADHLPEPWVEEAQRLLGSDRANEIYLRATARPRIRIDLTGEIEAAIAKAKAKANASVAEMNAAIVALLEVGVPIGEIEIIAEPHRGPAAWRVRQRRKVCDCGRAV